MRDRAAGAGHLFGAVTLHFRLANLESHSPLAAVSREKLGKCIHRNVHACPPTE